MVRCETMKRDFISKVKKFGASYYILIPSNDAKALEVNDNDFCAASATKIEPTKSLGDAGE